MRIAQVSPLFESVPPKLYGGTERIVAYLTDALVAAGHDVTLFASGDSSTRARHRASCERALRLHSAEADPYIPHHRQFEMVMREAEEFDIIHFHTEWMHFPFAQRSSVATLSTLHGRLDLADYNTVFRGFSDLPLTSISAHQRTPVQFANWMGTVHHGLPPDLLPFNPTPGDYLAFLGRISPEKRLDRAVDIARHAGLPLKVAAKVDSAELSYVRSIESYLNDPCVEFIGEIGESEKSAFLGGARALLFPIDWPEPFGLVMIEAMACGTPVIAFRNGAVPEVLRSGVSGFVVDDMESAIHAVDRLDQIDRYACRREFEKRFTATRMADDYVRIYERLIDSTRTISLPNLRSKSRLPDDGLHDGRHEVRREDLPESLQGGLH